MARKLDWDRMDVLENDRMAFLNKQWEYHSSGKHSTTGEPSENPEWLTGFKGSPNVSRKASQERGYHYKPGEWFEYNQTYGTGTLFDAVLSKIERGNRQAGVMELLGTNPHAMLDDYRGRAIDQARASGDVNQAATINAQAGKYSDILDQAMHIGSGPSNLTWANRMATARNINNFKLGAAVISSLNDMISTARVMERLLDCSEIHEKEQIITSMDAVYTPERTLY